MSNFSTRCRLCRRKIPHNSDGDSVMEHLRQELPRYREIVEAEEEEEQPASQGSGVSSATGVSSITLGREAKVRNLESVNKVCNCAPPLELAMRRSPVHPDTLYTRRTSRFWSDSNPHTHACVNWKKWTFQKGTRC